MSDTCETIDYDRLANLLDAATNGAGQPLNQDARARIFAFIDHPCNEHWFQCRSIVVTGMFTTVWMAHKALTGDVGAPTTGALMMDALDRAVLNPPTPTD